MMKRFSIITGCLLSGVLLFSCGDNRETGHAYMPDMAYSVAYETYAPSDERLGKYGATYTHQPVAGTIARGDMAPYKLGNDSAGYISSAFVLNPIPALDAKRFKEAERLYLINCAICHGAKLDGNGPLFKGGDGPFSAAPRNLVSDPITLSMAEGTMFHSITYGKNAMGSYASQLTTEQRWMIVHYIKEKQKSGSGGTTKMAADTAAAPAATQPK